MKKKISVILVLIMALTFVNSVFYADDVTSKMADLAKQIKFIQKHYYKDVDTNKLVDAMRDAMYEELDDYSVYLKKEDLQAFTKALGSEFVGIGVQFELKDGKMLIDGFIKGSNAKEVGMEVGDKIVKVNDVPLTKLKLPEVIKKVAGKENTTVKLTVEKRSGAVVVYTVIRRKLHVENVEYKTVNGYNVIRINSFSEGVASDFKKILTSNDFSNGLVIDMRGNPGGYLSEAVKICDMFLDKGKQIVKIAYKDRPHQIVKSKLKPYKMPITILVDRNTASASELVSAAMQDYKRAKIVGEKTYGKGVVQEIYQYGSGDAIKITVAEYITPRGKCIDKIGVKPDVKFNYEAKLKEILSKLEPMLSNRIYNKGESSPEILAVKKRLSFIGYVTDNTLTLDSAMMSVINDIIAKSGQGIRNRLDNKFRQHLNDLVIKKCHQIIDENEVNLAGTYLK